MEIHLEDVYDRVQFKTADGPAHAIWSMEPAWH